MGATRTGEALHLTLEARADGGDAIDARVAQLAAGGRALTALRVREAQRLYLMLGAGAGETLGVEALLAELGAGELLAAPATVDRCAVLASEAAPGGAGALPPGGPGWQFHVTVEARPGHEAVYERWKIEEGERQLAAPGFRRRLLLRSTDRPQLFFYQSFWDSEEQARAFGSTPEFFSLMREIDPQGAMARPQLLEECDLLRDAPAAP